MKKQLLLTAFLFSILTAYTQFITSSDTVLCSSEEITLTASGANITPSLVNTDDVHSGLIPIGFDFNFYGNTYNQCVISANGHITFDINAADAYSQYQINAAIPNPNNEPENSIMAPWHDIDPSVGGNIVFGTYGAAPNRAFYVVWCSMPMYSCNNLIVGQYILLFEGSNKIEMHLDEKPLCVNWNGGAAIQGIVNENSTLFEIVDDPVLGQPRNFPLQWTANDEGWEFIPNADFTDYTVNQIDYNPIATGTVIWSDQYGNTLSEELSLTVTPDTGDVYYYISVVDVCTGETINNVDSVLVQTYPPTNAGLINIPGQDTAVFLCDVTDGSQEVDVNEFLGDDYDEGGVWYLNNIVTSSQQSIVESSTGNYSYITYGINDLCNDTSFLDLNINKLPEAGIEGYSLVCSGDPTFSLFSKLNGNPQAGGVWLNPTNELVNDIFDPSTSIVGTYTYVVEGQNACPSDSQYVFISYQEGFNIETYSSPVTCNGYDDGSITLFAENNTVTPISYSIDGGSNYNSFNEFDNLEYGTYQIAVKDGNGCITEENILVSSAAPEINVLTTATDVLCHGDSSATISVSSIYGGNVTNSSYQYTWFNSGTDDVVGTDSVVQVPVGGYYLVIEDDNGCQGTDEVSVEQPNPITYTSTKQDITCFGGADGQIQVSVNGGGVSPYNFRWTSQGNATTSYLYNLDAGTYDLEIIDANNCVITTSFEIDAPSAPLSLNLANSNISCYGESTGSAQVIVTGGEQPYSYQWSSGHATDFAEQLSQGVYYVDVTDARGCMVSDSVIIDQNQEIINTLSSTSVSCYAGGDGSATVSSSGGTGNMIYSWSNGGTSTTIVNQSYGEYWVKVEDDLGCYEIDTIQITQPNPLKVQVTATDAKCFGASDGSIVSSVNGGTTPYTYEWSSEGNSFNTSQDVSDLASAIQPYVLTVADSNNCQATALAFIKQPDSLVLDTSHLVSAYCQNIPTGEVSVIASGGFLNTNGSYSFLWDSGETSPVLTNKNAGIYTAIVQDDNACKDTLTIEIPLLETFTLQLTSDSLVCYSDESGSATVVNSGGYAPYNYYWNSIDGVTEVESFSNSNSLISLDEGVTSVVVTDVNGCTKTAQVNVYQPEELIYTVTKLSNESCSGDVSSCDGVLKYTAFGGTGSYTFTSLDMLNNPISSYVTDSLAMDTSLCAGFYQIHVEDERGCSGTLSGSGLSLPVEIIAGTPVESAINTASGTIFNDIICYGDTAATVSVSNPNSSYTYDWYVDGQYFTSGLSAILPAGDVQLRAVSSASCYTDSEVLTLFQPSQLNLIQELESVDCNGGLDGSISIEASGGFPSYTYSWSSMGSPIEASTELTDLSAGIYTLTLKDANDCERHFDIEIEEPAALAVTPSIEDVSCNGGDDGSATLSISGGVAPYSMNWQGVDSTSLSADTYEVLITDANSCIESIEVEVDQPSAVVASFNIDQSPFTASANGGTPPYTFEWLYFGNYQSGGTTFTPLESGEYTLVAIDANDCEGRLQRSYTKVNISELNESEVLIYPNPVKDNFIIEVLSNDNSELFAFKLIDARGRVLREESFKNQIQIDRHDLAAGVYVIHLNTSTQFLQQKIIFSEK